MNDPRHPVQPAPATPAPPRLHPAPAQTTMPRPASTPTPGQMPQARPAHAPVQHAPHAPHAPHQPHQPHPAPRPAHAPHPHAHAPHPHAPPPLSGQSLPRHAAGGTINPAAAAVSLNKQPADDEEAISLVEDDEPEIGADGLAPAPAVSKIRQLGDMGGHKKHSFTRALKPGGAGVCRVRTFHAKLSDQGLEYLDDAINVWLDQHPEIDVKFVTSNIGLFDGKFKDLALIMNVWY